MSCCKDKPKEQEETEGTCCHTRADGKTECCTAETVIHTSAEFSEMETREDHCVIVESGSCAENTHTTGCACKK